jgi:hypothetical protein
VIKLLHKVWCFRQALYAFLDQLTNLHADAHCYSNGCYNDKTPFPACRMPVAPTTAQAST